MKLPSLEKFTKQQKLTLVVIGAGLVIVALAGGLLALSGLALSLFGLYTWKLEREHGV